MRIITNYDDSLWKRESAISLLKRKIGPMKYGQILKINKDEWEWKTEPYKMVYNMHSRGWVDFTVSARTIDGGWLLKKVKDE